jgi:ribose 5-phosphate isomerase A
VGSETVCEARSSSGARRRAGAGSHGAGNRDRLDAECFIQALGRRVAQERLRVTGVASSERSAALARSLGIAVVGLEDAPTLDLTIDGADEIGPDLTLIKGGGGALLREKVVAWAAREVVIIATPEKLVRELGSSFPLPLEVLPFAAPLCSRA